MISISSIKYSRKSNIWFEVKSISPTTKKDKLIQFVFFFVICERLLKLNVFLEISGLNDPFDIKNGKKDADLIPINGFRHRFKVDLF